MAAATEAEVNRLIAGIKQMDAAVDYVDHQICEMQLVSSDNYCMTWNTPGADNFPPAQ